MHVCLSNSVIYAGIQVPTEFRQMNGIALPLHPIHPAHFSQNLHDQGKCRKAFQASPIYNILVDNFSRVMTVHLIN
jgi:hypothetical protein